MSSESSRKDRKNRNPNRERTLYLINIILLCVVALAGLAFAVLAFMRAESSARSLSEANAELDAIEGDDKTLYTSGQVQEKTESAERRGARDARHEILMQIQSSLESGNSTTEMLRDLFADDLVVVSDGRYYFYPVITAVEKHGFQEGDFTFDDAGVLTYAGEDENIRTWQGIDVSASNGEIDWEAVAGDGIRFAMICAGTRDNDGVVTKDSRFEANMDGAIAAGVSVGVYWNLGAVTTEEASEEREFLINLLVDYRSKITCPVAMTIRSGGTDSRIYSLSKSAWTEEIMTFCDGVQNSGYTPMVYGNLASFVMKTDLMRIDGYQRWIQESTDTLYFPYSFTIWQYDTKGTVAGIDGDVHRDIRVTRG